MGTKKVDNDTTILKLKQDIELKESRLKATGKFTPVTNCSLLLDGNRYNLNVIGKEDIVMLLVKLHSYLKSAEELEIMDSFTFGGFSANDWITDLKARLAIVTRTEEEARLKVLKSKLDNLLSTQKKAELELADIAASI